VESCCSWTQVEVCILEQIELTISSPSSVPPPFRNKEATKVDLSCPTRPEMKNILSPRVCSVAVLETACALPNGYCTLDSLYHVAEPPQTDLESESRPLKQAQRSLYVWLGA